MDSGLSGIIEDEGYEVAGAADGYRAIELAKDIDFSLIFMDIKMPGINGLETYREIKKVQPSAIVVMMTGFAVEDLIKEVLLEGAYAVIYKPLDIQQVIEVVRAVLKTTCVLVVDDRAADRDTLSAVLEENGYEVYSAGDGQEAVGRVAEMHYGAILMDVKMPGMDGFATWKEITRLDPSAKVVFITGYALDPCV